MVELMVILLSVVNVNFSVEVGIMVIVVSFECYNRLVLYSFVNIVMEVDENVVEDWLMREVVIVYEYVVMVVYVVVQISFDSIIQEVFLVSFMFWIIRSVVEVVNMFEVLV